MVALLSIRTRRLVMAAAAAALTLTLASATALAASLDEYAVKSAFLLNFARLVEWPAARQPAAGRPFVVAVAGGADVEKALAAGLAGKSVGDNPVIVRRIQSADEVPGTHILYVAGDAPSGLLDAARRYSVLSVGESKRFAESGGVVNFFTQDQKLRFEINPTAASGAGLKISSRLLGLAVIVKN
jgi:hypothetical protein